ncbi:hypothetical protein MP228_009239 [Amoeboaphelidium protococcarum]|nr:hypothetical protein MP228_009239 [Amoeboaphelidium protococcarum]
MTVQNRTREFFASIESIRQRSGSLPVQAMPQASAISSRIASSLNEPLLSNNDYDSNKSSNNGAVAVQGGGQFSRQAAVISRDISQCAAKLEKLTKLAKKKSLFDDSSYEINDLTAVIKQDIGRLASNISNLEQLQQDELMQRQQQRSSSRWKLAQEHTSNIIMSLKSNLANASNVFKDVLEVRSQTLKAQQLQKDQLSGARPSSSMSMNNNYNASSSFVMNSQSPLYQGLQQRNNAAQYDAQTNQLQQQQQQQQTSPDSEYISISIPYQQQELLQLNQSDSYLESRAQAIEGIEKTITDLAGLFSQLTTMISQHDDLVRRIDDNVEDIESNVFNAQNQLTRYMQGLSSNRWLMAKIFAVLIVFFITFIMFFA